MSAVAAAVLVLAGCTSAKDPGPTRPSPQQSPAPQGGTPPDQPESRDAPTSLLAWAPATSAWRLTPAGLLG